MKPELILKLKEQFKAEQMAYSCYEAIKDMVDDDFLESALEEIMYDEYLHAKFVRNYLMEMNAYDPSQHPDLEKTYFKMMSMD
jgi:rubrerythrin